MGVKAKPMMATLGLGLAVGMTAGWLAWGRAPSHAAVVAGLLEERCLPYVTAGRLDVAGLTSTPRADTRSFAEDTHAISVSFAERSGSWRCHISDVLAPWTAEESEAVFAVVERFATDHVAPMNDGALVLHDVSSEGVGEPHVVWRRSTMELGFFVMFVRARFPEEQKTTSISVGQSEFLRPADGEGVSDA